MTVQNEVAWLIDVIKANYPTTWPDDLVRRNRDESVTLDKPNSPIREKGVDPEQYNTVGVSTGSVNRELIGTKPQYRVETELDVKLEGKDEDEYGHVASDDEFKTILRYIQNAINTQLTYPAVDTGDEDLGRVVYRDLGIINENNLSAEYKDYFHAEFTVRLRGFQDTP